MREDPVKEREPKTNYTMPALSVSEFTTLIKTTLEAQPKLRQALVSGEISNVNYHSSGHVYFTLKDNAAQLSCVMWRSVAEKIAKIKEGQKVEIAGSIEVYPPSGKYQLIVKKIEAGGQGNLYEQFLLLKEKLRQEGLFEAIHKKKLPDFPLKIGVLTSTTGAVIHDILQTFRSRYPVAKIFVFPTPVQGITAKNIIIQNLEIADTSGMDVLILARGGGSIEDLWNFNEEEVARAIFRCKTPIITGIGHETDTTIADFVADLRTETPTAAAVKAVPHKKELTDQLGKDLINIKKSLLYYIDIKKQTLENYQHKVIDTLKSNLERQKNDLDRLRDKLYRLLPDTIDDYLYDIEKIEIRLQKAMQEALSSRFMQINELENKSKIHLKDSLSFHKNTLDLLETKLQGLDITQILNQGYSLTLKDGNVTNKASLHANDLIITLFSDGNVRSIVG